MIRPADNQEITNWNDLLKNNPDSGHIYQTSQWAAHKQKHNWQPHFLIFENDRRKLPFLVIAKKAIGFGRIFYCPKGPGFLSLKPTQKEVGNFTAWSKQIRQYLIKKFTNSIMLIIEPEILEGTLNLADLDFEKSKRDLQFKATILVDLKSSNEHLIGSFKSKTRYNINLAKRKGVDVISPECSPKIKEQMYGLLQTTSRRAGFFIRPKKSYFNYWQLLAGNKMGQFFFAQHQNKIISGLFLMYFNKRAYFKDGGSLDIYRNVMAPYLLQYQAMQWAREKGTVVYDLMGVPPESQLTPEHSFFSLHQFKAGFNPTITEFVGCYDLILRPSGHLWRKYQNRYNGLVMRLTRDEFF